MTGAKIVGLRPDHEDELILEETPVYADADADEPVRDSGGGWIVPVLLGLTAVAWIAFVTWAVLAGPAAYANLAMIIGAASAPLALIGVVGVLALRTSRRESQRFLSTAQGMRAESSRLEARIAELTARIDANREALADQTVQLTQIGEEASARLATIVATVRDDGAKLDKHADLLGEAAARAGNEVNALLAALPKAQEQTSGIAAALNDAGETAMGQVSALEAQLSELAARGREADEIASGAAQRLAVHLAQIQSTTETARAQLDTSAEQMSEAVQTALSRAAEALEEARRSVEAQGAAMLAMVDQSKATLDTTGGQASEALSARIAEITVHVETLGRTIGAHDETGRALVERLSAGLGEVEQRLERLDQSGTARTEQLATAMERLSEHADRLSTSLAGAGDAADGFIARSESLLTALDASAREIDETLPAALARLDGHAEASRVRIEAMRQPVGEIEAGATSALDRLAQTEKLLQQQREAIELFGQAADRQLQAGKRSATELAAAIDTAHGQMAAVADGSGPQLIDVIGDRIERQVLAVAEAAERAVTAANAAAALLQDQIAKVEQGTATLEARVESARERSEEASGESFSRRASLLMEALNSTAIDVAKILSNEVTDSAWAAYLKGDRGVFTRRAVRLLEAGESRTILGYYESDPEFRDQVSRYIHDFEAMLRNVLATREGSQIAITLLSSDMGKLYVALAQAIERLRA
jgi:predicted  nucleic acid-binding Zn-ribbon protein